MEDFLSSNFLPVNFLFNAPGRFHLYFAQQDGAAKWMLGVEVLHIIDNESKRVSVSVVLVEEQVIWTGGGAEGE